MNPRALALFVCTVCAVALASSACGRADVASPAAAAAEVMLPVPTTIATTTTTSTSTTTTSTTTTTTTRRMQPVATKTPPTTQAPEPEPEPAPPTTAPALPTAYGIGDSIMLGAKSRLEAIPGWTFVIDAKVSRQFSAGLPLLADAAAHHPQVVVLHLGTNGPVSDAMFDSAMAAVAGVPKLIVLTIQLPPLDRYAYEDSTNDVIKRGAARYGATVVDWNAATNDHPELFAADGIHPQAAGSALYASLVTAAL
jgi:GDSL-like Lipase/Acylhydrolase family